MGAPIGLQQMDEKPSTPVAMQVLFGINPDSPIYQSAKTIFSDHRTYVVAAAAFAAVGVPMLCFVLYDFFNRKKSKYRG